MAVLAFSPSSVLHQGCRRGGASLTPRPSVVFGRPHAEKFIASELRACGRHAMQAPRLCGDRSIQIFGRGPSRSGRTARRGDGIVVASSGRQYVGVRELPIFPLGVVAFPAATVILNIFEARYRVLFSTLLAGDEGVEEGLINPDSPYVGTREFGLNFYSSDRGLSKVGTLLRIKEFQRQPDGQIVVVNVGMERFRILEVKKEAPVLICNVEFIDREFDDGPGLMQLRDEVAELCRSTLRLSSRMSQYKSIESTLDIPELERLGPHDLSCWMAFNFIGDGPSKQAILEIDSTRQRLETERNLLKENLKYLSAAAAVESAFKDE